MIKDTDIKAAHIILGQFPPARTLKGCKVNYFFLKNCNLEGCKAVSTKLFCLKKAHKTEKLIRSRKIVFYLQPFAMRVNVNKATKTL